MVNVVRFCSALYQLHIFACVVVLLSKISATIRSTVHHHPLDNAEVSSCEKIMDEFTFTVQYYLIFIFEFIFIF